MLVEANFYSLSHLWLPSVLMYFELTKHFWFGYQDRSDSNWEIWIWCQLINTSSWIRSFWLGWIKSNKIHFGTVAVKYDSLNWNSYLLFHFDLIMSLSHLYFLADFVENSFTEMLWLKPILRHVSILEERGGVLYYFTKLTRRFIYPSVYWYGSIILNCLWFTLYH